MKSIVPMRVGFSATTVAFLGVVATTSCESKSQREPETQSAEQQRMQTNEAATAQRQPTPNYNSAESTGREENPPPQGRYQGTMQGTVVEPGAQETPNPAPNTGSSGTGGGADVDRGMQNAPQQRDVHQLTLARCEREARCSNIGRDRKYESTEQCVQKLDTQIYSDLGPDECKSGIRRDKLDSCLNAIRNEECNSPLDSLKRLTSCRAATLCAD